MKRLFPTLVTNANRADAGSLEGVAGRVYLLLVAKRLESDKAFLAKVCRSIRRNPKDFNYIQVGKTLPRKVESVIPGGRKADSKTSLRIIWKDGRYSNFLVKKDGPAQICLKRVENFIPEFEAQFRKGIPAPVKEALLLFVGGHERQKAILDAIPLSFGGPDVRTLERAYNNRLTLATMYGYDEALPRLLMSWLRDNAVDLFEYCFAKGAARERNLMADYLWYHSDNGADSDFEILDLRTLINKLKSMSTEKIAPLVHAGDRMSIGSTIDLPFGNLQYHEGALQFRHEKDKIEEIAAVSIAKKNTFGSAQKVSGHQNEMKIAEYLNTDKTFRAHFCSLVGKAAGDFHSAEAGGMNAKQEVSVLGGKTPGKTDVTVLWQDGSRTNISVKKNPAGQVYLVTAGNFAAAFKAQFGKDVPREVVRALQLFIGEAPDSKQILDSTYIDVDGEKTRALAYEQHYRLVYDVIAAYDLNLATRLLSWLKTSIVSVFELCFSSGAVANRSCWSDVLWYKNVVDQEGDGLDYLVDIGRVKQALAYKGDDNVVEKGPKNGGSTVLLPFGHVQYHSAQLEFYQKMKKIQALIDALRFARA